MNVHRYSMWSCSIRLLVCCVYFSYDFWFVIELYCNHGVSCKQRMNEHHSVPCNETAVDSLPETQQHLMDYSSYCEWVCERLLYFSFCYLYQLWLLVWSKSIRNKTILGFVKEFIQYYGYLLALFSCGPLRTLNKTLKQ